MNVEDSYEGAVRRLRRLGHAGFDVAPPSARGRATSAIDEDRMRDLEELATLACDDNERLTSELDAARAENERLRRQVTALQEMLAGAQPDEAFDAPTRGRGFAFYFFVLALLGAAGVGLYTFRPWERARLSLATASATSAPTVTTPAAPAVAPTTPAVAPTTPVVAAPAATTPATTAAPAMTAKPTTAPVATSIPKIGATVPTVGATIPKAAPLATATPAHKSKAARHHAAKHHSHSARHAAKHGAAAGKSGIDDTSDPLGGVNL